MLPKILFLIMAMSIAAFAQAADAPEVRPFHIGIVYPLSTNGHDAPNVANNFSAHLIWGVSAGVEGFEFAGFGSTVNGDVNGFQASGFINITNGSVLGVQTAGFMNITNATLQGLQTAGFMNITNGDINGVQVAGFMNTAQNVQMLQAAGFMNIASGSVLGAQGAGFMNIAESVSGLQVAGFLNIAENSNGLQTAGFMNIAEDVQGLQNAGFMNIAENVRGLQAAGFMNIAKEVDGAMVAGFMNIADRCDYPIGIVNIIGNGKRTLNLSGDELGTVGLSFKSGRKTYGIIGGGYNSQEPLLRYNGHVGLGYAQKLSRSLTLDLEVVSAFYAEKTNIKSYQDQVTQIHSLKLLLDYPIGERFGVYAGPTLNFMQTNQTDVADLIPTSLWDRTCDCEYGQQQKLYAGANVGIYYRFKN